MFCVIYTVVCASMRINCFCIRGVKVLHKPHQNTFYYCPDKVCPVYTHYNDYGALKFLPHASFEATKKKIIALGEECLKGVNQHFFIKDMAYYMSSHVFSLGVCSYYVIQFQLSCPCTGYEISRLQKLFS